MTPDGYRRRRVAVYRFNEQRECRIHRWNYRQRKRDYHRLSFRLQQVCSRKQPQTYGGYKRGQIVKGFIYSLVRGALLTEEIGAYCFKPDTFITRAEFIKILSSALEEDYTETDSIRLPLQIERIYLTGR